MNCLSSTVKYILYIFNLIFVICGILLITAGSIMLSNMGDFKNFEDAVNTETIPILIIVLGCIIFLISFFGCCGAIKENACCMTTYAVCMFVLFVLQIALCVWIFVQRSSFLDAMGDIVDKAWQENTSAQNYPMDGLQLAFKCCGKYGPMDYSGNVPASCCGYTSQSATCDASIYQTRPGCRDTFIDFWSTNTNIVGFGSIGVALIELIAFTFACCLANSIRKSR